MTDRQIRDVLSSKRKSSEICKKLNICDREWRTIVHDYNEQYDTKERLIVGDQKGYEITTNKKQIRAYAIRLLHHSLSELKMAKSILKSLSDKNQLTLKGLDKEETDIVDIAMRLKI